MVKASTSQRSGNGTSFWCSTACQSPAEKPWTEKTLMVAQDQLCHTKEKPGKITANFADADQVHYAVVKSAFLAPPTIPFITAKHAKLTMFQMFQMLEHRCHVSSLPAGGKFVFFCCKISVDYRLRLHSQQPERGGRLLEGRQSDSGWKPECSCWSHWSPRRS